MDERCGIALGKYRQLAAERAMLTKADFVEKSMEMWDQGRSGDDIVAGQFKQRLEQVFNVHAQNHKGKTRASLLFFFFFGRYIRRVMFEMMMNKIAHRRRREFAPTSSLFDHTRLDLLCLSSHLSSSQSSQVVA